MNTLVLDDYTINLIKTMALCKTVQMKAIERKVMAHPFASRSDKWMLFFSELQKNGVKKSDDFISDIIYIVIDTWMNWHTEDVNQREETDAVRDMWPALELTRIETQKYDRDWDVRWHHAADAVNWEGVYRGQRFIALRTSPIWGALGNGAGGFVDCWGLPYPPFAIGSGMGWMQIEREECISLGLITEEYPDRPLSEAEKDIVEAIEKYGMPKIEY